MHYLYSIEYLLFAVAFLVSVLIAYREGIQWKNVILMIITFFLFLFHSRSYIPGLQSEWLSKNDYTLIRMELLIEIGLYLLLYISLIKKRSVRVFLIFYLLVYVLLSFLVVTQLQTMSEQWYPVYAFVPGSFGVLLAILFFFYEKLNAENAKNIFTDFWFWISAGLFLFLATEIPAMSILNCVFEADDETIGNVEFIFLIKLVFSLFYYFTYVIGLLCNKIST